MTDAQRARILERVAIDARVTASHWLEDRPIAVDFPLLRDYAQAIIEFEIGEKWMRENTEELNWIVIHYAREFADALPPTYPLRRTS